MRSGSRLRVCRGGSDTLVIDTAAGVEDVVEDMQVDARETRGLLRQELVVQVEL